jgi:uncharacterized protein DUF2188
MAKKTTRSNKRIHVISRDGGWAVKKEGSSRASKIYSTKDAAVRGAKKTSKGQDVVVHKKDGSIEKWYRAETEELHATSFLKTARGLELEGPADWSARLEEYLYDDPSARGG